MDDPSNQISIRIHYLCGYAHQIKPFTIYVDKTKEGKGSNTVPWLEISIGGCRI